MTYDLSVLIPARNEYYEEIDLLNRTVTNVLANTSERTQIIAILDGYQPPQPLPASPRVTVVHHPKSIGQRAACNEAARLSTARWIMKLDAHCAVSPNFDQVMIAACDYNTTLIPTQYNLHVFSWRCKKCKHERYQSPKSKCTKCGSQFVKKVVYWQPRGWRERDGVWSGNPRTTAWYFDSELNFQYAGDHQQRHEQRGLTPTMTCLGACWMLQRERYWELGGMDERAGSWGQQGVELAMKTWLSGGQMLVTHDAWFAHFFRTGQIGFPYEGGGRKERAVARCRELWLENKWPGQRYPLSWLVDKFKPVRDWHVGKQDGKPIENAVLQQVNAAGARFAGQQPPPPATTPAKCVLYYTCNSHDETLELAARANLLRSKNGYELGCVSRERTDFGDWNIVVDREKSGTTMHYQILAGLERSKVQWVFLCESDVMYHPSHFEFMPPRDDTFYYNTNVWRVRYTDGHAVRTDNLQQVSGICASRKLLLEHYRKRIELIERNGGQFDTRRMAYEPGTRGKFGDERVANWQSPYPNLDITGHGQTLTTPHFSVDSFRNPRYAAGWQETDDALPGWKPIAGRVSEWLNEWLIHT
jgi:hypothetical protein